MPLINFVSIIDVHLFIHERSRIDPILLQPHGVWLSYSTLLAKWYFLFPLLMRIHSALLDQHYIKIRRELLSQDNEAVTTDITRT